MSVPPSRILQALVDTFLPSSPGTDGGRSYPSGSEVGTDRAVAELVAGLGEAHRREFASLLRAVDSPFTNLVLTGRPVRFSDLDPPARERYLQGWSTSRLALKRKGFQAAKRLASALYYSGPTAGDGHPLWDRIHYAPPARPSTAPVPPGASGPICPTADTEETADVCVVGSGAGGAVIAARTAAAGYRVVVLEAGSWIPTAEYPRVERDGYDQLFVGRGVVPTRDSAFAILAGSAVGGSTAVNWMTCLPPLATARREWATDGGLVGIDGPDFDRFYAAAAARLSVSDADSDVNPSNDVLRRGAIALGYRQGPDWDIIRRNALGCRSRCGFCTFGCPYDARRSTLVTYLADALRDGARLYARTRAERVEIQNGRATAVVATYQDGPVRHTVKVRARAIVVAGGALGTPALLARSDLRFPGLGLGLRLDPTTALAGEFPKPVRTWEGPHQTIGVYRFQSSDAEDHGPWIEVAPVHPGLSALAVPWTSAADHRRLLERIEHVATPIVLVRDVAEGRVRIDREGHPIYDYRLTPRDRANLVRGLGETARLLVAAGATRLISLHTPYIEVGDARRPVTAAELDRFVSEVERAGIREHSIPLFSAHPMGSARAGTDPRRSTARPTGEVHGVEGLWIGDGSLLPSAPGANPMMSILALAERTSGFVIERLAAAP